MLDHMQLAHRFVGLKEMPGHDVNSPLIMAMLTLDADWPSNDEVPWCAGYVGFVCWLAGLPRTRSLRARSWHSRRRRCPQPANDFLLRWKLLRASTASVTQQAMSTLGPMAAQDSELARIYSDDIADRDAISEPDQKRFDPLMGVPFTGFQQQFRLANEGSLSSEAWAGLVHSHRWLGQQPGVEQWWRQWGNLYRRDFRDYVDGLIREGEAAG